MTEERTTQVDDYIDPILEIDDDADYVRCTACNWTGYVTAGAEDCPQCHANGRLQWAEAKP